MSIGFQKAALQPPAREDVILGADEERPPGSCRRSQAAARLNHQDGFRSSTMRFVFVPFWLFFTPQQ